MEREIAEQQAELPVAREPRSAHAPPTMRPIEAADLEDAIRLLTSGFPNDGKPSGASGSSVCRPFRTAASAISWTAARARPGSC